MGSVSSAVNKSYKANRDMGKIVPFETYLQHHTTWSREDFKLLQEVVFEHLDELNRNGLNSVLKRLKNEKKWQGKNPRKR